MSRFAKLAIAIVALVLVAGCATTQVTNSWRDPTYNGPPFKSLMVIAATKQTTLRRIFEDEFARMLKARSIDAIQSYTLIPEDGEVSKERLTEAVKASGVQGILITRWVKVERRTDVYPGTYWGPPACIGYYGCYSSMWFGAYDPPQVYTYDIVTTDINLLDATGDKLVWSATGEAFSQRDVRVGTEELADAVLGQLAKAGLI